MLLPFTAQQIFFVAIIVFILIGLQRGWRRELVSLVFILLAVFIVNQNTSISVGSFFSRLPAVVGYAAGGSSTPAPDNQVPSVENATFWSLLIFAVIVWMGYYIGNRAFPSPAYPQERFIGIIPSVVGGAFILGYLSNYFRSTGGQSSVTVSIQAPNPTNFITIIFVIALAAAVIGLITARIKRPAKK